MATKPVDQLRKTASETPLRRALGTLDLTAFGVGTIIGTGIFVIIGEGIADSGPGIIISFLIAGVTCVFSALAYAELSSAIPVAGSAYTYAYAAFGELIAFVIGWDLLLEYGVAVAAVAVGWGGYLAEVLSSVFSVDLPAAIVKPPGDGGTVNVPAVALVCAVAALLITGVRETARSNSVMVVLKVGVLLLFIVLGVTAISADNFEPFAPNGFDGIVDAAALIFFAYIGFDAISTAGEEAERPERTLPIAIISALAIATVLYIAVSVVVVGLVPSDQLAGDPAPLATALTEGAGLTWGADLISIGALIAITSVVLTLLFGQTRIAWSMCRDRLLPERLAAIWERTKTPALLTVALASISIVLAAFVPLGEIAELVNIGTLFAFFIVNIGIIVLRRTQPDLERGFRVPLVPLFPLLGAAMCVFLMTYLSGATWLRFGIWMAVGLVVYAAYGYRRSRLRDSAV